MHGQQNVKKNPLLMFRNNCNNLNNKKLKGVYIYMCLCVQGVLGGICHTSAELSLG